MSRGPRRRRVRRVDAMYGRGERGGCPGILLQTSTAILPAIPPVLDSVVAAAFQHPGDIGPLLADDADLRLDEHALALVDRGMIEIRVEVLMPAFTALLWSPVTNVARDLDPLADAPHSYPFDEIRVLLLIPRAALLIVVRKPVGLATFAS